MYKIKAQKLTVEGFSKFGSFIDMIAPEGYSLDGDYHKFFRDRVRTFCPTMPLAFSPLVCKKRPLIIDASEYHNYASEILLPIDDDVIIHAAPASAKVIEPDQFEAFIVPKGTLVAFNIAVWHLAPIPMHNDWAHCMVALPERTYANDCIVVNLNDEQKIEIEL